MLVMMEVGQTYGLLIIIFIGIPGIVMVIHLMYLIPLWMLIGIITPW